MKIRIIQGGFEAVKPHGVGCGWQLHSNYNLFVFLHGLSPPCEELLCYYVSKKERKIKAAKLDGIHLFLRKRNVNDRLLLLLSRLNLQLSPSSSFLLSLSTLLLLCMGKNNKSCKSYVSYLLAAP